MLGNCEKMAVISSTSTTNEWPPQPQDQIDEKGLMMDSSANRVLIEKPNNQDQHQQQQQQQVPLKCPRCDSSNTKFCYYNNYSLSQPRHFCKACKRYWTRGGTLRNVPVGGGCRKNKRVKRPASANEATSSSSAQTATSNPSSAVVPPQIDLSSSATHINPLFYSLLTNNHHPSDLNNLSYPRFSSLGSTYDLHQPQMNGFGLGFSSGLLASEVNGNDYRNGGFNSSKQIQDVISSNNSLFSSYNPIFGSSSTSTSTMASLIASSLQRQKFVFGGLKDAPSGNGFHGFEPYHEDMQMVKDVKMEEGRNRLDWDAANGQNHMEQINSDPSLLWNTTGVGAWLDPANMGSSVPSLI